MQPAKTTCRCGCGKDLREELERHLEGIEDAERSCPTTVMNQKAAELLQGFDAHDCLKLLFLANEMGRSVKPSKYHLLLLGFMIPTAHAAIAARMRQILRETAAAAVGGAR